MRLITDFKQINTDSKEGKLLMAAMAKITTESQTDKTPDEVLNQVNELAEKMYETDPPLQVYRVDFRDTIDLTGEQNMKSFDEFCVKCHADKNTRNLATVHLAVIWHFATGKGIYTPAE